MSTRVVLAATDLSESGDEAVRHAHRWALQRKAELVVCHAVSDYVTGIVQAPAARDHLVSHVEALTSRSTGDFTLSLLKGSPAAAIVGEARARGASLVVVGAGEHGILGGLLGGTSEQIVRHVNCPVLIARPSPSSGPVLAAVDFSDPSLVALKAAAAAANYSGTSLVALHSVHQMESPLSIFGPAVINAPRDPAAGQSLREAAAEMLKTSLERLKAPGQPLIKEGRPGRVIVATARELGASLVVVAHKGRSNFEDITLGSEAYTVIRGAHCSVLVVRIGQAQTTTD